MADLLLLMDLIATPFKLATHCVSFIYSFNTEADGA
jgi:hypothetical protein